jgi:hypothetical protein
MIGANNNPPMPQIPKELFDPPAGWINLQGLFDLCEAVRNPEKLVELGHRLKAQHATLMAEVDKARDEVDRLIEGRLAEREADLVKREAAMTEREKELEGAIALHQEAKRKYDATVERVKKVAAGEV